MNAQRDVSTYAAPRRRGKVSSVQIVFAVILAVGLILALNFSSRISATQPMQREYQRALAEIEQLQTEQAELIRLRDYVRSDAYVQQWARSDGKMARPGEVLIVPVPLDNSGAPTPTPAVNLDDLRTTPIEPEPWEVWWALFMDSPPPISR
jgi:cell division protein FtsB